MLAMGLEQRQGQNPRETFPSLREFIKEAQMHHHSTKTKCLCLESKGISKRLGKSPDIFDSVLMGFWLQLKKHESSDGDGGLNPAILYS